MTEAQSPACSRVRELVAAWSRERDRPFPYNDVGGHLADCISCLIWSTTIAHRPGDRYIEALNLRLGDLLTYLGESLLAVVSSGQEIRLRFDGPPAELDRARAAALQFLNRYEGFSAAARSDAGRIRALVSQAGTGTPRISIEPFELIRYFFTTARSVSAESEKRLSITVYVGITENYQALRTRAAGDEAGARLHFAAARTCFSEVMAVDPRRYKGTAAETAVFEKNALVAARINLAGTEVQEAVYSVPALRQSVELLQEARRLIYELGLTPAEHAVLHSNLLISYLRLALDHLDAAAMASANALADEVLGTPGLSAAFVQELIVERADPELTDLLGRSGAADIYRKFAAAVRPTA